MLVLYVPKLHLKFVLSFIGFLHLGDAKQLSWQKTK